MCFFIEKAHFLQCISGLQVGFGVRAGSAEIVFDHFLQAVELVVFVAGGDGFGVFHLEASLLRGAPESIYLLLRLIFWGAIQCNAKSFH